MKYNRENVPQRAGKRKARNRWMLPYFMLACLLLTANMTLLLEVQSQIKSLNASLNQVMNRMTLAEQEGSGVLSKANAGPGYLEVRDWIRAQGSNQASAAQQFVEPDYVSLCGLDYVEKPRKRTEKEVLDKLLELSMDNDAIGRICGGGYPYSSKMLEALANNPEMALFVEMFPESEGKATGGLTAAEKAQKYPLFLQWDPRWGYVSYGDNSNVGLAGCGPTCLSMAMYYLLGDETLTPDKIAGYSMKNGYYMTGTGTAWALLKDFPEMYGLSVAQPKVSEKGIKDVLDQGGVVICSMKPGDFTAAGHFVVIYGYDSEGFLVNDPNCVARSRESWSYDVIGKQIKQMWTYQKGNSGQSYIAENSTGLKR